MSGVSHARLNRQKRARSEVPPLWETTFGTVISNLSEQHTDDFVKMILMDSEMRKRFTDELLRKATHIPDLGDSDIVEFVSLPVNECPRPVDGHEAEYHASSCRVGQLPYWLQGALKAQFRDRASCHAKADVGGGEGRFSHDGRIEFDLYEDSIRDASALVDAYIDHLEFTIEAEGIPNKEEAGYPDPQDDIDLFDVAPGVQPDTVLYDAWDMSINDAEGRIREEFDGRLGELFMLHMGSQHQAPWCKALQKATANTEAVRLSTVWVRKPRVRIVLHPSCE